MFTCGLHDGIAMETTTNDGVEKAVVYLCGPKAHFETLSAPDDFSSALSPTLNKDEKPF